MTALTRTAAAEWLKLRSVRSTWWFAAGALVTMLLVTALNADSTAGELRAEGALPGSVEAASVAVTAMSWVHYILGALGMLTMTGEYATRAITVSLACTPARSRLLLAKAAVVGVAVLAAGVVLAALGVAVSTPLLREYGHFDAGQVAARILAMGVHLALIAVLALGLGTLIRRSAGTITVLFVLLALLPNLLQGLAEPLNAQFLGTVATHTPAFAGERFMTGEPAFGLVLAAWAAAAVAAGIWALRTRDA